MKEETKLFWKAYDLYIGTGDVSLRNQLSGLLRQVENKDKRKQILRPEKGWGRILAWQVLGDRSFNLGGCPVFVYSGEVIIWQQHRDRDVILNRIPMEQTDSGILLNPGCYVDGKRDERGLYLPLYSKDVVIRMSTQYLDEKKKLMLDCIERELIF